MVRDKIRMGSPYSCENEKINNIGQESDWWGGINKVLKNIPLYKTGAQVDPLHLFCSFEKRFPEMGPRLKTVVSLEIV